SLLLRQVLRESGKPKERTLQSRAENVRGTDHPEPVHGITWGRLPNNSGRQIALSLRSGDHTISRKWSGIHPELQSRSGVIDCHARTEDRAAFLSSQRATPRETS